MRREFGSTAGHAIVGVAFGSSAGHAIVGVAGPVSNGGSNGKLKIIVEQNTGLNQR